MQWYMEGMTEYERTSNESHLISIAMDELYKNLAKRGHRMGSQSNIQVVDLGCGEGQRTQKTYIGKALDYLNCAVRNIKYTGIDYPEHRPGVMRSFHKEIEYGASIEFVAGDCFDDSIQEQYLPQYKRGGDKGNHIVITSHSMYFAKDKLASSVDNIANSLAPNGISLFTHDGDSSLKILYSKYSDGYCANNVANEIEFACKDKFCLEVVQFVSKIRLPIITDHIKQSILTNPQVLETDSPDLKQAKLLLSFAVQNNLEDLHSRRLLAGFLDDAQDLLRKHDNCFFVENKVQIIVPNRHSEEFRTALKESVRMVNEHMSRHCVSAEDQKQVKHFLYEYGTDCRLILGRSINAIDANKAAVNAKQLLSNREGRESVADTIIRKRRYELENLRDTRLKSNLCYQQVKYDKKNYRSHLI